MDKNYIHPSLEIVVPEELRFLIYQEALDYYENEDYLIDKYNCDRDTLPLGLCLLLPCMLWDLKHFLQDAPDGENWDFSDTRIAFPEIKDFLKVIGKARTREEEVETRISVLKQILKSKN